MWRYSRAPTREDPARGWKIHLSATVLTAHAVLTRVSFALRRRGLLFKVPARLEFLASLNSGLQDYSQTGKFVTVYPRTEVEAVQVAAELHHLTRDLRGPKIPFDQPYRSNGIVYYRHGAFSRRRRHDAFADPFRTKIASAKGKPIAGPIGRDYLVLRPLSQRGKGGVYEAAEISAAPVRLVILKQGRRDGETNWDGKDGYALVKHEAQVLRRLRKTGLPVPEIFRGFTHNGNRYIVLEKIGGRPLLSANRVHPLRISWRLAEKILEQLEPLLSKLHASGWVWRDCKPSHIFRFQGTLRLIDFEGACNIDQTDMLPWGSPDYMPPGLRGKSARRPGTFEDDYALGVIAFQFLAGEFPPPNARKRAQSYRRTACPDSLRDRIERLLRLRRHRKKKLRQPA